MVSADFTPDLQIGDGQFCIHLEELGLVGAGVTIAAAKADLLQELRAWAEDRRTRPELAASQDRFVSAVLAVRDGRELERLVFGDSEL